MITNMRFVENLANLSSAVDARRGNGERGASLVEKEAVRRTFYEDDVLTGPIFTNPLSFE